MVFNILFLIFDFQGVLSDSEARPYDLHALSTPPAFILDQDQILINRSGFTLISTPIYAEILSALISGRGRQRRPTKSALIRVF